ncbi:MAG: nitroreductase family deazaflavin-dependent oxidoreductase [Anaerolineae bacterium]|nr:nitroreductase family deazaflavin-dependent oxidoreductase [Anaerolineae bacterium]
MAETPVMRVPAMAKWMMRLQAFLLRRNWMGAMGDHVLVLTVTGRKTGRTYSTPVGYLREGPNFIALNPEGKSNWYRNIQANPAVRLNVRGQEMAARAVLITDAAEIDTLFQRYHREITPDVFPRLFGVAHDAPEAELLRARDSRRYVRFVVA